MYVLHIYACIFNSTCRRMCLQQSAPIELKHEKVLTKPVQMYVKAHVPAMKKVHSEWSQQEIMANGTLRFY